MAKGTVRWFDGKRGYGVISPEERGQPDLFVDLADVVDGEFRSLRDNDAVEYDAGDGPRGVCARHVRLLPAPSVPERTDRFFVSPE